MLTLRHMIEATPAKIKGRARQQCFAQTYAAPRQKAARESLTKSGGYIVEDESGRYREFKFKTKCTDGWRKVAIRFYGPMNPSTRVWCWCSCPYFKYNCEVALASRGSSAVVQSNGQRPRFTNPKMEPRVCVVGESLIDTEMGLMPASDISVGDNLVTMTNALSNVTHVYKHTMSVRQVLLSSGRDLVCTDDHPILTLDRCTFTLVWKNAVDLMDGDLVAVRHGTHRWPEALSFDFKPKIGPRKARVRLVLPTHMSNELARLLGYLVSEGSAGQFSNTDKAIMDDFILCSGVVFDYRPKVSKEKLPSGKTLYRTAIVSKDFTAFMKHIGYDATTAYQKVTPWSVLRGPREPALHYLAAFLDGDGSVDDAGTVIRAGTVSKRLMQETQTLLSRLGIDSSLWKNLLNKDYHGKPVQPPRVTWFVSVSGQSAGKLAGLLPPLMSRQKREALAYAKTAPRVASEEDVLPGLSDVLTAALEQEKRRRKTTRIISVDGDMTSGDLAVLLGAKNSTRGNEYIVRLMASVGVYPTGKVHVRKGGKPTNVFSRDNINKAISLLDFCEECNLWVMGLSAHERTKHNGGVRLLPRKASKHIYDRETHYKTLKDHPELAGLLTDAHKEMLDMDLRFEQVVNNCALDKERVVYDFTVDAGHFKANSMVVHNCKHVFLGFALAMRRRKPGKDEQMGAVNQPKGRMKKVQTVRAVWAGDVLGGTKAAMNTAVRKE